MLPVRKLAERSSKSTKEIAELIELVQKGTREAVAAMDQGVREIESGSQLAAAAGDSIKKVMDIVQAAANQTERISQAIGRKQVTREMDSVSAIVEQSTAATQEMAASSQQVGEVMEKIAAVSEETTASVEEVSASAQEMNARVEEVSSHARELAKVAGELRSAVGYFKVGKAGAPVMRRRAEDWTGGAAGARRASPGVV